MIFILIFMIFLYLVNKKKRIYKLNFPKNKFKCKCDLKENFSNIINENLKKSTQSNNKISFNNKIKNNNLIFLNLI